MSFTSENPLLLTDVYKLGHLEQYAPGINKLYTCIAMRSNKKFKKALFVGLQYYSKEYLSVRLTPEMGEELIETRNAILGSNSDIFNEKVRALCKLGYFPIEIKAIEEGTVVDSPNVVVTVTNTLPEFYWVPGFLETMMLKIWYPITVATCSLHYRELVEKYFKETVPEELQSMKPFMTHDFGARGCDTEESAGVSGFAHICNFVGSDTVIARKFSQRYYSGNEPIMLSCPASEHGVSVSFGRDNELQYFHNMLDLYPSGIVSLISDTYDLFAVLTDFVDILKDKILARDGKAVFRPDSYDPIKIICGDDDYPVGHPRNKGCLRLLEEKFGSVMTSTGYKVLNPKVGLIQGDGMFLARYDEMLWKMKEMGFAASNLVIGVGTLMRYFTRDDLGFANKASYVEINGEPREVFKDPVTDPGKKSNKGLVRIIKNDDGVYETKDQVSWDEERSGELKTVFLDGKITREFTLSEIRERVNGYFQKNQ